MIKIVTNYTVTETGDNDYQLGWRNFIDSRGNPYIELRYRNDAVLSSITLADFKRLMLTGEQLTELMAKQEKLDEKANR